MIWRKLFSLILSLFAVAALCQALLFCIPGDPVETLIAETGLSVDPALLRKELGLDQSFLESLTTQLKRLGRGEFGKSLTSREEIGPLLFQRVRQSAALGGLAFLLGFLLSAALGILAAKSDRFSRLLNLYTAFFSALPAPWLGPLLLFLTISSFRLYALGESILLPAIALSLSFSVPWGRIFRDRVQELLRSESVRAARARGVGEARVLIKYALYPSLGGLIPTLGLSLGGLLSGTVITETVFDRPGLGLFLLQSVLSRDLPSVQAAVFVSAAIILIANRTSEGLAEWIQKRPVLL
jgi:peptide/nickel transport system permease protein